MPARGNGSGSARGAKSPSTGARNIRPGMNDRAKCGPVRKQGERSEATRGLQVRLRRHAESEPIPYPSLQAKRSNPGAAVRPFGLLASRMLWPLDCFVARAPRNDVWVAADPIDSVIIGRRLSVRYRQSAELRNQASERAPQ